MNFFNIVLLNINHKVHREDTKNTENDGNLPREITSIQLLMYLLLYISRVNFLFVLICVHLWINKYLTRNVYIFLHRFTQINTDDLAF